MLTVKHGRFAAPPHRLTRGGDTLAIKIFVDQGHNPYGVNAGAEAFGVREQDITYLVGAYLVDILNADPRFDAIASRQTPDEILGYDNNSSLRERVDMANTWGADYFISIHTNANTNPAVNGTECYVYSQNNPAFYRKPDCTAGRHKRQRGLCPPLPLCAAPDADAFRPRRTCLFDKL